MRENIRFLVFWARLTSLRMMFSNSIHAHGSYLTLLFFAVLGLNSGPGAQDIIFKNNITQYIFPNNILR
jgi:hypothetical protein